MREQDGMTLPLPTEQMPRAEKHHYLVSAFYAGPDFVPGYFAMALPLPHALRLSDFPLVMDRRMKGVDAVKLSFQAAKANLGGLLLLALGNALLGLLGVLCCYVGAFLVMPVTIGAQWICYERIFGIQAPEAQAPQG